MKKKQQIRNAVFCGIADLSSCIEDTGIMSYQNLKLKVSEGIHL